jgi:trk system potassium uptake protein TrkH
MGSAKANRNSDLDEKRLEVLPLEAPSSAGVISILVWAGCLYLILLPIGDVLIRSNWPAGAEISFVRGRFMAANALTLTGFEGNQALEKFPAVAKVTIFALTVLGALFAMILGTMAVVRILRWPYSDGQIAFSAVMLFFVPMAAGCIPLIAGGLDATAAFMLSASALANSGLYFGAVPSGLNWQTHLVLMPLAILGSLGLPVLMELTALLRMKGRLSQYSRTMLGASAWIYLLMFAALVIIQVAEIRPAEGGLPSESETIKGREVKILASSSVMAIDSRTAGFPIRHAQVIDLPRSGQWFLILAMMVGGCAAGTAGGIKINTLVALWRGIRQAMRGGSIGRPIALAVVWVGAYLGLALLFFLMMLWAEPEMEADRLLFLTVSALSNVGLSHDPVSITGAGLDVLAGAMLLGRLVPLGMLWWMATTTRGAEMPVG